MRAVIYARFSSDRQREESIEGQLRECHAFAESNGITVINEYIDRALTATKETDKRLDFLRMIKDSEKGLFDIVLVWKLDRFARNRYDSARYKHILKKNGVKVVSATERISDGPDGIMIEALFEGMAEYYSAELSQKIRRGQTENALKAKNNGGGIPLGYVLNKETQNLEIDELTAPIVREIMERYASGESIAEIKDDLNNRGIKTSRGSNFTHSTFKSLLSNRKYIGEYRYRDIIIPKAIPAIVSEDVFNRVRARMEKNKHAPAAAKASEKYLLTTKLFCGKCACMMVGESGTGRSGKKHHYYKCVTAKRKKTCDKTSVKKKWIEDIVVQQTMLMVMDDVLMKRLTDRLLELQGEDNYDLKLLQKQLNETEKGIENIVNAIQAGIITASTKQRLEALEREKIDVEQRIIENRLQNPALSREQIEFYLERFKFIDTTDENERQRLIDSFVNAIYLYDDKIVLTFNYKDGTKTISLNDVNGSDLENSSPPK